jgi:glycerol-3-phosphate dehydrogenase
MTRDLEHLTRQHYDLFVIGGGVHGLFAAYDAALRGLSVVLVDRGDFGGGLSFNHQRTIHGGLRALERGNVRKARQQIAERRAWARIAPHLLRPLPFLIGTYRWTRRSRWALKAGFAAYDFVGRGRNTDVVPELHVPKARLESAAATRKLFPGVSEAGLTGGAVWYDYQTRHPDRLTWTVALAADQAGAKLLNYVEAVSPIKRNGTVVGARVRDALTGAEHEVEAAATLVAAGSRVGQVLTAFGATGAPPLLRAMNVLLNRPARDIATAAAAPSGRMLTAVPWCGYVLVGTHQSDGTVGAEETRPPGDAVESCLRDLNAAFPRLHATPADIRLIQHGLAPATVQDGRADLLAEPRVIRHTAEGAPGLVSLVGVKYTTARLAAERAVDAVCHELGRPVGRCRTGTRGLPHAGVADVEGRLMETLRALGLTLDPEVLAHLASWYGTEASDLLRYAAGRHLLDRLDATTPVITGEIAHAAEFAQAVRLSDAVLRRTSLGSAGHPGSAALERAAEVMGAQPGWSTAARAAEIAAVEEIYPVVSSARAP